MVGEKRLFLFIFLSSAIIAVSTGWFAQTTTRQPATRAAVAHTTYDPDCIDQKGSHACRTYGQGSCVGIYEDWGRVNCAKYCGYCIGKPEPCVDNITNCASYTQDICTNKDYRIWAEDHCNKYCGFCGPNHTPHTPAPVSTNTPPTTGPCKNIRDDCDYYLNASCIGIYGPWANANCALRCGYCPQLEPCFDKLPYCDQYSADICTAERYFVWSRINCRKYCNLCYNQTNNGTNLQGPIIAPSQPVTTPIPISTTVGSTVPSVGVSIGNKNTFIVEGPPSKLPGTCLYKGNTYSVNTKWYDECNYVCECFDTTKNRMICTDRCTQWTFYQPIDNCKLVDEPGECCHRLECTTSHA